MSLNIKDFILLALICYLLFQQMCGGSDKPVPTRDTIIVNYTPPDILIDLPPSQAPKIIYQPIPADIDSFAIAQLYFSQVRYQDTVTTDSIQIHIDETISRNAIQSRLVGFKWLVAPCSTSVVTIHPVPRNKVYLGGSLSYQLGHADFSLMGGFQNKRDQLWFVGWSPVSRSLQAGGMVKVRLRN